jgi:hypothetical protein
MDFVAQARAVTPRGCAVTHGPNTRFPYIHTQHGKKSLERVGKQARKCKQNRKCPQRGKTSSSGESSDDTSSSEESSDEESRSGYSSSEEDFYRLCDAVKSDVKETGDTSFFPKEVVDNFVKHVDAIQHKSSGSEDKPQINSELAAVIPHGPMRKPKVKHSAEYVCRTMTLKHNPNINRMERNITSTCVMGEEKETHVSTRLAWEATRRFCKGLSYETLIKRLQKHNTWTWEGKVVFERLT